MPTEDELADAMRRLEVVKTDHNGVNFPVDDDEKENSIWLEDHPDNFGFEGRKPEDREFEDEVKITVDKLTKDRFAKFRGLKSLKHQYGILTKTYQENMQDYLSSVKITKKSRLSV